HPTTPDIYTLSLHDGSSDLKTRLDALRVARHAVAEDKIEDRREHVAGRARRRRRPLRIDARDFDGAQEVEDADDHDQCRVLEQADRKSTRLNSSHVAISYAV